MKNFLPFWFVVAYNRGISIYAQANLSNFPIRNSFISMDSKSNKDATDEPKGSILGEYSNDGEA